MSNLVVTTGRRYVDIDGLSCVIAYKEIPEVQPIAVINSPLNYSITAKIRTWNLDYQKNLLEGDYEFVVVDTTEKSSFPYFVKPEKVIEIYDHHFGFEKEWREKLGEKAKIETVGACATLIWEEFKKRSPNKKISSVSANLLYTAICSNTLNFQASLTTDRDKKTFEELKQFIDLPESWISDYYRDQEAEINLNPTIAIGSDTKVQTIKGRECAVGHLELWRSREFVYDHLSDIEAVLSEFSGYWFFTSPSISEGKNYIFTKNQEIKDLLSRVLSVDFSGTDVGVTRKLWLRKEILKKIQ